ncbi:MAG: T9SS type A sorting domain-containing protein [Bacteroidales bacterium]|nr:T9SS type A sorting domain-containing protein [Bacteroidales bacterium]
MKLVDDTIFIDTSYTNPITDGATLVFQGNVYPYGGHKSWLYIPLQNSFVVPQGKSLKVYWEYSSQYNNAEWYWSTNLRSNSVLEQYENYNAVISTGLPTTRFIGKEGVVSNGNGGAGGYVYVDTTNCKNNRSSDEHVIIDDALAMWSKIIYPASKLQAGTISKIGFYLEEVDDGGGRYTPVAKPNVFIYMRATNDTAITSSTYVQPFAEGATLVWNGTVPAFDVTWQDYWYDFNLQVPFTINNGENLLVYIVDSSCSTSGDCYYMWYMNNSGLGDSRVGSLYSYCNYANASGYQDATPVVRFYYEGAGNGSGISNLGEYVYTDTSNMNPRGDEECVIVVDEVSGWQKYLYYASEISANEDGGTITRLGFYLKNTDGGDEHDKINQYVFMQAVSDTEFVSGTYVDPIIEGATLVWSGTVPNLNGYSNYWYDFNLQQPFTLPPGYHLKVTIIDSSCTGGDDCYYWYCQQTNNDTRLSAGWWSRCDYSNSTGRPDNLRPVARFYMPGSATNVVIEDAVALENIISPRDGVPAGNMPIEVVIRNKGENILDSCLISYAINNGTPIVYTYRGNLEEDFVDTVTIGTYNGVTGHFDSLVVYVSYPNGVADQIIYDDTLDVVVVPCGGNISGTYIVGSSANAHFANFEQFKQTAKYCGMSGTVKLAYENGTYDNIDLSDFTSIKNATDTLIITSQSGNAADVVFTSATASYIINIGDNKNVYLQNITINNTSNSSGERSCVYLKAADNIEIAGCVLNLPSSNNTTNSSAILYNGYNYNPNNNFIGNVRILNNTIIGGYRGICIQRMNSSSQYNNPANITIVGNTIKNFECQGIYSESYCSFDRITDNKIICGSSCLSSFWGIYMNYVRIDTIARNVITIEGVASSSGYGMYLYQVIGKGNGNCFVVNNEIFEKKNNSISGYVYGIYFSYSSGTIYHNTVYLAKNSGIQFCFYGYQNSSNLCSIKNNIFYSASQTSAPVYLYSNSYSTFNIDYNNYYSANPNNCVRWSNTTYSLSGWKQFFNPLDSNSISVVPNFRDTSINLDITNYNDMIAQNVGINEDIIGNIRLKKTPMGAHAPYIAVIAANLSAVQIVEPMDISIGDGICAPDYTPVKVIISNTGTDSVDFALTPMRLSLRISGTISLSIDTIINIGGIDIFEQDTFELISNLNIAAAGAYYMTAFLTCAADTFNVDDTISKTYAARMPLPMDENFAGGLPSTLSIIGNNANSGWKVVGGNVNNVVSQYGNAMLEFEGTRGTESKLCTGQMSFVNVNKPTLEFWYYHDTSSTSSQRDFTSVAYTIDGGTNFKELLNLYKNNGTDHGWKHYTLSLDSAVGNSCVNIIFYTMRSSTDAFDGSQYIDRIRIYTKQDVAVSEILLDNMTTCHLYSDVNVVLENKTNQLIDFSETPTDLQIEIVDTTNQKITISLNSGVLMPLQTDTLTIATAMSFINGNYTISAKIVSAIDDFPANDTLSRSFVINPSIDVAAAQVTGGNDNVNCIGDGSQVNQVVTLENDGNMDMEDVILTLNVYDITGAKVQTIEDTLSGLFAINQIITYTFAEAYDVPEGAMYNVEIVANPMCNASLTYTDVITECVDQSDVEVTAFINPTDDETCSSVGTNIKVKVRVSNNHPDEDIEGVVLNVVVTSNNNQIASWTETLDVISAEDFIDFEFPHGFNVPEEADYTIVAYVNSVDTKSSNDTLSMTKCTDLGVVDQNANAMSLGQNIPNPAKTQTVVNYTVPTEGTVVFTLTTVTGQVIYTQSQEVEAGRNSVEFNTENLAVGIYFYTMDFNGQRLTKKMTVKK